MKAKKYTCKVLKRSVLGTNTSLLNTLGALIVNNVLKLLIGTNFGDGQRFVALLAANAL